MPNDDIADTLYAACVIYYVCESACVPRFFFPFCHCSLCDFIDIAIIIIIIVDIILLSIDYCIIINIYYIIIIIISLLCILTIALLLLLLLLLLCHCRLYNYVGQ